LGARVTQVLKLLNDMWAGFQSELTTGAGTGLLIPEIHMHVFYTRMY